jgi:hypothetical protein
MLRDIRGLQGERALQWAIRQNATFLIGTEPYALNNEEVKYEFERRIAPIMGDAALLAPSLPTEQVFVLTLDEVWKRSGRQLAIEAHDARVTTTVDRLYEMWSSEGARSRQVAHDFAERAMRPEAPVSTPDTTAALGGFLNPSSFDQPLRLQAMQCRIERCDVK